MEIIKYIVIHNTGGLLNDPIASTQHLKATDVERAHGERWSFMSSLGSFGGYNFFINKDGELSQFRKIGEETIAQRGHNLDSISICLAGNFSGVDKPSGWQELRMKNLILQLLNKDYSGLRLADGVVLDLDISRVVPHRTLVPTTCYGSSLHDNWAKNLVIGAQLSIIQIMIWKLQKLITKKLGLVGSTSCLYQ